MVGGSGFGYAGYFIGRPLMRIGFGRMAAHPARPFAVSSINPDCSLEISASQNQ